MTVHVQSPSFFLIHYAKPHRLIPFGVVAFDNGAVHWRFRDDVEQLAEDPMDQEILGGTGDAFAARLQTLGPTGFLDWMSHTLNLSLRLTGPYSCQTSASEIDEALVESIYAQHISLDT